jgi:beta-glucosidase
MAQQVDQVVLCIGLNKDWESEGFDREDMNLQGHLNDLTAALLKANPNTAVAMQSDTPVEILWLPDARALLHAWYGGNETGNGIADVLFGDVNPSGKLSLSFPVRLEDNPAYLNYRSEAGRVLYGEGIYVCYRWYESLNLPTLFPFGFGLSYTTFDISNLHLDDVNETEITATVELNNTGALDGAEVLQIYFS